MKRTPAPCGGATCARADRRRAALLPPWHASQPMPTSTRSFGVKCSRVTPIARRRAVVGEPPSLLLPAGARSRPSSAPSSACASTISVSRERSVRGEQAVDELALVDAACLATARLASSPGSYGAVLWQKMHVRFHTGPARDAGALARHDRVALVAKASSTSRGTRSGRMSSSSGARRRSPHVLDLDARVVLAVVAADDARHAIAGVAEARARVTRTKRAPSVLLELDAVVLEAQRRAA